MGFLRLYLALCVVAGHAGAVLPWEMHNGRQAVQIFFIISGFYIELILSGKYHTKAAFYKSRALRIFPPYAIVAAGVCLLSLACRLLFDDWLFLGPFFSDPLSHNGLEGVVAAAITNLTVVGQDWIVFLKQGAGQTVTVVRNLNETTFHLYRYLIIPQAWSVALELCFYALAPFLCRLKTKHLISLALVCVACRLVAVHAFGLGRDPWTYRFFPFEIAHFVYGMLAYRLYRRLGRVPFMNIDFNKPVKYAAFGGCLLAFLWLHRQASNGLGSRFGTENVLFLVMLTWVPLLAFLFRLLEKHPADRFVGELTYPIYLVHLAVFAFQGLLVKKFSMEGLPLGVTTAVVSIGLACVLNQTVLHRLEQWRQRRITVLNQGAGSRVATACDVV